MNDPIEYESGESSCCGAKVYSDLGICTDCKEHCDVISEESVQERDKIQQIHANYPNLHHGPGSSCPIEFCSKCKQIDEAI